MFLYRITPRHTGKIHRTVTVVHESYESYDESYKSYAGVAVGVSYLVSHPPQ